MQRLRTGYKQGGSSNFYTEGVSSLLQPGHVTPPAGVGHFLERSTSSSRCSRQQPSIPSLAPSASLPTRDPVARWPSLPAHAPLQHASSLQQSPLTPSHPPRSLQGRRGVREHDVRIQHGVLRRSSVLDAGRGRGLRATRYRVSRWERGWGETGGCGISRPGRQPVQPTQQACPRLTPGLHHP